LLYLLLLKNEAFYKTNGFFLLGGLILAFFLPLFPISIVSPIAIMNNSEFFSLAEYPGIVQMQSAGEMQAQQSARFPWWNLLLWFYLAGLTLFLVRLVWQTLGILWKIRHVGYQNIDGAKVIDWKTTTPFSFFNVVFIDIQEYSERELSNIIAHEKVHIRERHWIDLLIIELLAVLFWVNPVVWLYEKSIKQNHEYLADQGVLLAGYSPGQYQALLINQLMGVKVLGFAHNLNFSLNKKRMEMMKKEKSPGASKMKLLLALPVIALLVFAFAKKEYAVLNETEPSVIISQTHEQDLTIVNGVVLTSEKVPMEGANIVIQETTTGTITNEKGEFKIESPSDATLVVSFIGYESRKVKISDSKKSNLEIVLKEGVFNIEFPEKTGDKMVNSPPPPPPLKTKSGEEIMVVVEDMPVYKNGGMYKLALDIRENTASIVAKTSDRGEAIVGFTVEANGKVTNAHIVQSANSTVLDKSALEIVRNLDNWNPGVQRGKPVKVNLTVPVNFN
jgi:TonB family protein